MESVPDEVALLMVLSMDTCNNIRIVNIETFRLEMNVFRRESMKFNGYLCDISMEFCNAMATAVNTLFRNRIKFVFNSEQYELVEVGRSKYYPLDECEKKCIERKGIYGSKVQHANNNYYCNYIIHKNGEYIYQKGEISVKYMYDSDSD